jgi:hypothetical protein
MKNLVAAIALLCLSSTVLAHDIYTDLRGMIAYSGSIESMNANVRKLAVKKFLLTSVAALFLATGAAHAEYETMQGIDWKCPGGVIVRFDRNGGKYEKGSTETVVITALQFERLQQGTDHKG